LPDFAASYRADGPGRSGFRAIQADDLPLSAVRQTATAVVPNNRVAAEASLSPFNPH